MTHYFITSYFNYCDYDSRYQLTRDFIITYPGIYLIEVAFEDQPYLFNFYKYSERYREENPFWITNKYFNKFVEDHPDLISLTFIDSDCILWPGFFASIVKTFDNTIGPLFIQPFHKAQRGNISQSGVVYEYKTNKKHC